MNILELKAADLGGAIAHVAASQLYQAMTEDDEAQNGPRTWFGSDPADSDGIETDVLDMARYVNGRDIPAEQLWRWAGLNGIVVREVDEYRDVPLARRLAFEIFTDTCARAHHRLELAQLDARKMIPLGEVEPPPGLKLEDSIFEPHGSLDDQEAYQKQWLKDQEAADQRRLEEEIARQQEPRDSQTAGAPIDEDQDEKPAGLSAGQREDATDEEEAAAAGQETGDTPPADPAAQGTVSDLPGDDRDGDQDEPGGASAPAGELEPPLADAEDNGGSEGAAATDDAGEGGAVPAGDADAANGDEPGADSAPGAGSPDPVVKTKKPAKGKSTT